MDIIQKAESIYQTLSKQESKVALAVIQRQLPVQNMTITELAKCLNVSAATITRFCKKMDCSNFFDLKLKLNASQNDRQQELQTSDTSIAVYNFYQTVISETQNRLDEATVKKVVTLIINSTRIFIFGLGSSGYTAKEFGQRLIRMGLKATAITDSHMMFITAVIMQPQDLLIGLSTSGKTKEVIDAMEIAKKNGASTVALTGFQNSGITHVSDHTLFFQNSTFVDNQRFINSQFAMTYVIDIISMLLLEDEKLNDNMKRTVEMINNL